MAAYNWGGSLPTPDQNAFETALRDWLEQIQTSATSLDTEVETARGGEANLNARINAVAATVGSLWSSISNASRTTSTTFTVAGTNATSTLPEGTPIRATKSDTTFEYYFVKSSSYGGTDTVVTVDGTIDATVTTGFASSNISENQVPKNSGGTREEILDTSGNELMVFNRTASAVNHVELANNSTGSAPIFQAAGDDTNIDLKIKAKGTGVVRIGVDEQVELGKTTIKLGTSSGDDFIISNGEQILNLGGNDAKINLGSTTSGYEGKIYLKGNATTTSTNAGLYFGDGGSYYVKFDDFPYTTSSVNISNYDGGATTTRGISLGGNSSGTFTPFFNVRMDGRIGIGTTSPGNDVSLSKSKVGGEVNMSIKNTDNTDADSDCRFTIVTGGSASGDPMLQLQVSSVKSYYMNIDNSDSDKLKIGTSQSDTKFVMETDGTIGVGTASPDAAPGGITLKGSYAGAKALTFKNPTVSHGVTDVMETDTGATMNIGTAGTLTFNVYGTTLVEGHNVIAKYPQNTTTGYGMFYINCLKKYGTGTTSVSANDNMFTVRNNSNNKFLIKGDGDLYASNTTITALDEYDDIQLARNLQLATGGRDYRYQVSESQMQQLVDVNALSENGDFQIMQGCFAVSLGAISQLFNGLRGVARNLGITDQELLSMTQNYS
jgi:hypothetical protein